MSIESPSSIDKDWATVAEKLSGESRFGNEAKIVEALREGEVSILGPIDSQILGVKPSTNKVDLVSLTASTNAVHYVNVAQGNNTILGVFKPFRGEDTSVKERLQLKNLFSNEAFAYQVSQHFNFDIVPPTVIRTIAQGLEGSLQYFLPTNEWQSQKHIFDNLSDEQYDNITSSDDWIKMALLDFLILNPDRHEDNLYIEKHSPNKIPRLAAIDNGNSNSVYNYNVCKLHGPALSLTHVPGDPKERPRAVPIPRQLLEQLENALTHRLHFPVPLPKELSEDMLELLWIRAEALLQTGIVLSRHNLHFVTGNTNLGGRHPEMRAI